MDVVGVGAEEEVEGVEVAVGVGEKEEEERVAVVGAVEEVAVRVSQKRRKSTSKYPVHVILL